MYKITKYDSIKSPQINSTIQIEDILNIIKNGDENLPFIELARECGKGSTHYDLIKIYNLPTFRCNFLFDETASNKNITTPTGLIYIDVDSDIVIPENEYVFASWKSLSNVGNGLLVKVDNLSVDNFKYVYKEVSELIGVESDKQASKPTQQTVLSYDSNLYYNSDSITYSYTEPVKVSSAINLKKEKRCLSTNDTFIEPTPNFKVRYNNINDYFKNTDDVYKVFENEKELICNPFVPRKVELGRRNSILFIFVSQIVALNPSINKTYLKLLGDSVNVGVMRPKLLDKEINSVINSVFRMLDAGTLKMIFNQERRILFNPSIKMEFKDKMVIVNEVLGKRRREATKAIIYAIIEDWNFLENGKIIQKKVAELSGYSAATIKRYWHHFKAYIGGLNDDFKNS